MRFPISIRKSPESPRRFIVQEIDYEQEIGQTPFIIDYLRVREIWTGNYNSSHILPIFAPEKVYETPIEVWLQRNFILTVPVGFIFHTSRCGSTLFCQAAKCCSRLHVLSEPPIINAILDPELDIPQQDRSQILLRAV